MNYTNYNDYELLYLLKEDDSVQEILFQKYKPLISKISYKLYNNMTYLGLDINDLIQEGRLGLNLAIDSFVDYKDTSFYTYAKTCIERKIISIVVGARRQKHKILNESLSLECDNEINNTFNFQKNLEDNSYNPENILLDSETQEELIKEMYSHLTNFEIQVAELKINGFDYREIAEILDKDIKSIDNALQRIRTKLKNLKGNEKVS